MIRTDDFERLKKFYETVYEVEGPCALTYCRAVIEANELKEFSSFGMLNQWHYYQMSCRLNSPNDG